MNGRYVLRNARKVSGETIDIVVEDGKIAEITAAGSGSGARELDCSGLYVSSGWIDLHVHAFPELDPYGDEIDAIGVRQGVTTVVDAGSCGADRIADLIAYSKRAKTNLYAFLNISRIGLQRTDELSNPDWIDRQKALRAVEQHRDAIVGLKARISRSVVRDSGLEPLRRARRLSRETSLPLMAHIGSGPPDIREILPLLAEKDIVTHYLHGKPNNLFDGDGRPLRALTDALARGVRLDVGHGAASFSFRAAEAARRHGIRFDTISTDIYRGNRLNGPVYSLSHVLAKFLYLGYTLEEVIAAVTTNAAAWLGKPELGRIRAGEPANLTLFSVQNKPVELADCEGERRMAGISLEAKGAVVNGEFIACEIRSETCD
jgi:dihydroorotase